MRISQVRTRQIGTRPGDDFGASGTLLGALARTLHEVGQGPVRACYQWKDEGNLRLCMQQKFNCSTSNTLEEMAEIKHFKVL